MPQLGGGRVLPVGGGRVTASKLDAWLAVGARLTVVAPAIRRELEPSDLAGAQFVLAAAPGDVNWRVAEGRA